MGFSYRKSKVFMNRLWIIGDADKAGDARALAVTLGYTVCDVMGIDALESKTDIDEEDVFVLLPSKPESKEKIVAKRTDLNWVSLVHPTAIVGANVKLGRGVIIGAGVIVGADVRLGDFVSLESGCILGQGTKIDDFTQLGQGCNIGSHVRLKAQCCLGAGVIIADKVTIREKTVLRIGEIVLRDMTHKMVYKRGTWIYKDSE